MGNASSSSKSEKKKRRKHQTGTKCGCNPIKKRANSSTDTITCDDENLPQEKRIKIQDETLDESKTMSVWICRNRQLEQRKEIDLGFSPTLNTLIEQINKNFDGITENITLTFLSDDIIWSEIREDNTDIALVDLGINHHGIISIEDNSIITDDVNDLPPEPVEKICLIVKDVSSNKDIEIELDGNTTLAMLKEKIHSEFAPDFQIDYLQIKTSAQSGHPSEDKRISSYYSMPSTPTISTDQNEDLKPFMKTNGHYGLRNLGNTCFMNSALQSLSNVQSLTDYFLINETNIAGDLAQAYHDFIKHIWISGKLYNPKSIRACICDYAPQFDNFEQHDAHEFLIFLLNQLHEDLREDDQASSVITKLFNCQIDTITTCLTCQKTRQTANSMNFVPLSLDKEKKRRSFQIHFESIEVPVQTNANGSIKDLVRRFLMELKRQKKYSIEGLFERITVISTDNNEELAFETSLNNVLESDLKFLINEEILREENEHDKHEKKFMDLIDCFEEFTALETPQHHWFCKMECNQPVYTAKRMLLASLSPVLIIQLKRFTETNGYMRKLETLVKFPTDQLDLKRFMINQNETMLYDLVAVVNHTGNIHRGHYTTYARQLNDPSKGWFCFNDDIVVPIDPNDVVSSSAYILIYIKRQ